MCKVIGIDVSKASFDFAYFEAEKWKHGVLKNNDDGFVRLNGIFEGQHHFVMEASGPYYLRLAMYLHSVGHKVSVINPLIIRRYSQMRLMRAKTDKKDAKIIADYAMVNHPKSWQPVEKQLLAMQQILTVLNGLSKQKTMLTNQMEAFDSSGILDPTVKQCLSVLIKNMEEETNKLEEKLDLYTKECCKSTVEKLKTIPGIGKKTATLLAVASHNFTRFQNAKQLIAFIGFSPRIYQSGTSVNGKGKICKMGNGYLRKLLYLCSWSAKKHNPQCKEMYERLKEKGKPERVIKVAIANKLIKQAFAIATNNINYEKNYLNPKFAF